MYWLIGLFVVGALAWLLWRRKHPLPPVGAPHVRTTIVVIEGSGHAPTIPKEPEDLEAEPGDHIVWEVENRTDRAQKISFERFKHKTVPGAGPPLEKNDADRHAHVPAGQRHPVRDKVKPKGTVLIGRYKYDIHLNDTLAVDPEIMIKVSG